MENPVEIQRKYYAETASKYDEMHVSELVDVEHISSLHHLSAIISIHKIKSVLDIGSGTGRTILFFKDKHPELKIVGIEPVKELREQGHAKGIPENELVDGDGYNLNYKNGEFDLVCEVAVLHHVEKPEKL
jgi:ubiquinone/menaquinone biosynthesis C-methylase UbiE